MYVIMPFLYIVVNPLTHTHILFFFNPSNTHTHILQDHWRNRQRGLLKDFATDQLMRGKFKSGDHHAHHHSIMEDDAEDYDYMRGE